MGGAFKHLHSRRDIFHEVLVILAMIYAKNTGRVFILFFRDKVWSGRRRSAIFEHVSFVIIGCVRRASCADMIAARHIDRHH